jgi:hypothetical protein
MGKSMPVDQSFERKNAGGISLWVGDKNLLIPKNAR